MLTLHECYEILGLQPNASSGDVRRAYVKLVKQWHPDTSQSQHSPAEAQQHFLQIQKAYERIKQHLASTSMNEEQATESEAVDKTTPASNVSVSQKVDIPYNNAVELGRQGLYREAIAELSIAIRNDPNYARAYQYRGHLKSLLGLERQAEADLNKAKVLNTMGQSASYKSPEEIEAMARRHSQGKRRPRFSKRKSRFKRSNRVSHVSHARPSHRKGLALSAIVAALAIGTGVIFYFSTNNSSAPNYSPLELEAPSIES